MSGKPVGHVDTWTAYVNSSNSAVIQASDFVGMDAYPYFQNTMPNSIENGASLFFDAYNATVAVSQGKPVWITETGWPVSGPTENQAVASLANAKTYWDQVGCRVFGQITTFWYTLQDAFPTTPSPSFGVVGTTLSTTPLYDLSCAGSSSSSSSSTASSTSSKAAISSRSVEASTSANEVQPSATTSASVTNAPSRGSGGSDGSNGSGGSGSTVSPAKSVPANTVAGVHTITTYTTLTICPVTYVSGSETKTSMATSAVVVTATQSTTLATVATPPAGSASGSTPSPTSSAGSCPAALSGDFQYPHLIIPVDKSQPDTAFGTSFNGQFSPTVSSIFNFDLPASYQGRTCDLVFLFPTRDSLHNSNYTLSSTGGIEVTRLSGTATSATTYNNQPPVNVTVGSVPDLQPGNSYDIAPSGTGKCFFGTRVSYKVSATGSLSLDYFQDYNPAAIGLYITVC